MTQVAVFGCGNTDRGDDAAGVFVIRELAGRVPKSVELHEIGADPVRLLDFWPSVQHAIVVDAMVSGVPAGTVQRFGNVQFTGERFTTSTHGITVREVIELARTMRRMPGELTVIGIEGADFGFGRHMSTEVLRGVREAADLVLAEFTTESRVWTETE